MEAGTLFLLSSYASTVTTSLGVNLYNSEKSFQKAKKESRKKLKYRKGLSTETKVVLRSIYIEHLNSSLDILLNSIVPIKNVLYTLIRIENKDKMEAMDMEYQQDIVSYANGLEDYVRYRNAMILRDKKDEFVYCPDKLSEQLDDENCGMKESATKLILKLNGFNYRELVNKYEDYEKY